MTVIIFPYKDLFNISEKKKKFCYIFRLFFGHKNLISDKWVLVISFYSTIDKNSILVCEKSLFANSWSVYNPVWGIVLQGWRQRLVSHRANGANAQALIKLGAKKLIILKSKKFTIFLIFCTFSSSPTNLAIIFWAINVAFY